jgi:integrase
VRERPRPFPRHVSAFRDRHGKLRTRYRRTGCKTYYFAHEPFSKAWWAEYKACDEQREANAIKPGESRTASGTVNELIVRFYESRDWQGPSAKTRHSFRLVIERFRAALGEEPVASFDYGAADKIMAKFADRPTAGNKLRKLLIRIWNEGKRLKLTDSNPWELTKPYKETGSFHTWTEGEIRQFKARWPIGTKQYLALALLLNTAQRSNDVRLLGPDSVRDDRLCLRQTKTDAELSLPIVMELRTAIKATRATGPTFLQTGAGKAFTQKGFGNWFSDACKAAGVPGRAHGLRKAAARRLAEAGASQQELKAWTGHKTDSQVRRYVEAANQADMADAAANKMANRRDRLAKNPRNPLNPKG